MDREGRTRGIDKTVKKPIIFPEFASGKRSAAAMRGTLGWIWTIFGPFLGLVLISGLFAWLTPHEGALFSYRNWHTNPFLSPDNWRTIGVQAVTLGIAALGMTLVMIAGGIDLSIGSAVALVTVIVATFAIGFSVQLPESLVAMTIQVPALPIWAAMLVGVLAGGLCGLFNGALITRLGVVPFIITLGSLKIFRGLAKWLSGGTQVYVPAEAKPQWLGGLLSTTPPEPWWLLVAPGVWVLLGLALGLALMLRYSVFGRYLYAVGSSEPTARLCGINVPSVKILVYGLAGLATGMAGAMQFANLSAQGDPGVSDGLELQVIAAVVIGGGSLSGGEGTILGTLIGTLIIIVLDNGCVHVGYSNAVRDVIIGAIIVVAVALDRLRRRQA
ncbi:MAG: permease component of ribose/xylose/arabinose/galactoside ABC-type transporter [Planctomycetota bacterium]|nr:permease component of ribose/xylose/arabinose/galactoside ABC-type transporter [Planctomycetota bacterium]